MPERFRVRFFIWIFFSHFFYFQIKKSISEKIINFLYTHRHTHTHMIFFLLLPFRNRNDSQKNFMYKLRVESQTKKALYCDSLFLGDFFVPDSFFFLHCRCYSKVSTHMHSFEAVYCEKNLSFFSLKNIIKNQ